MKGKKEKLRGNKNKEKAEENCKITFSSEKYENKNKNQEQGAMK